MLKKLQSAVESSEAIRSVRLRVRNLRSLVHFARIARDPNRLGDVFEFMETLRDPEILDPIIACFKRTPEGARGLASRVRVGKVPIDELRALPEGTLGRVFARHLDENGLDPDAFPVKEANDDYGFMTAHFYETHDIWHALTGFGADVAGELGLQAFYVGLFPARLSVGLIAAGMANALLYRFDDAKPRMHEISRGYIMGIHAKSILGVDWKMMWAEPLHEIRARYGIDVEHATRAVDDPPLPLPRSHQVRISN